MKLFLAFLKAFLTFSSDIFLRFDFNFLASIETDILENERNWPVDSKRKKQSRNFDMQLKNLRFLNKSVEWN